MINLESKHYKLYVFFSQFLEHFLPSDWNVRFYSTCLLVPLILLCLIRNLRVLAPVSAIANVVTILGLGIILAFIFKDLPSFTDRPMYADFMRFPMYLGIVLFSLCSIGLVMEKDRKI